MDQLLHKLIIMALVVFAVLFVFEKLVELHAIYKRKFRIIERNGLRVTWRKSKGNQPFPLIAALVCRGVIS